MAKRHGRRRIDGIFEYSDSRREIETSAIREDEESLRDTLAVLGIMLGTLMTCGLVGHYAPDWPKTLRFASILAGGNLCGYLCAINAFLIQKMFATALSLGVIGGAGYLLWKLL